MATATKRSGRNRGGANDVAKAMLLDALDCAFDRRSWHGANLMSALRGVPFAQRARRVHGRRSIWEQLLHAAYWKHRVLVMLTGKRAFPRKGSDWPRVPQQLTEAAWRADVEMLRSIHRDLRRAVIALAPGRIDRKISWQVHGAVAHDVYHAGQIKLLRRLIQ